MQGVHSWRMMMICSDVLWPYACQLLLSVETVFNSAQIKFLCTQPTGLQVNLSCSQAYSTTWWSSTALHAFPIVCHGLCQSAVVHIICLYQREMNWNCCSKTQGAMYIGIIYFLCFLYFAISAHAHCNENFALTGGISKWTTLKDSVTEKVTFTPVNFICIGQKETK